MRTCNYDGCEYPVFGGGFCKYHQGYRTDKKNKSKVFRKSEPLKLYIDACKNVDKSPDGRYCVFCGKPIGEGRADHHHLLGRVGDKLCDESLLKTAHRLCHATYHSLNVKQLYTISWYPDFVTRLKHISMEAYEKELRRISKSK